MVWLLPAGFMMSNFEADDPNGLKGQASGPLLPFAGWEDPPMAALHHLHQVSHNCCLYAFPTHKDTPHGKKAVCTVVQPPAGYIYSRVQPVSKQHMIRCQLDLEHYSQICLVCHIFFPGSAIQGTKQQTICMLNDHAAPVKHCHNAEAPVLACRTRIRCSLGIAAPQECD